MSQTAENFIKTRVDRALYQKAILIRMVENKFLQLFSEGQLNGTVHTCVGQEFSALAFAGQLTPNDIGILKSPLPWTLYCIYGGL